MRGWLFLFLTMALAALPACSRRADGRFGGDRQRPAPSAKDTEIFRVVCFFPPNMWKSFDSAGDRNPEGFAFVMYLISGKTGKGIYADGTFRVELYRYGEADRNGRRQRDLVFDTAAPMAQIARRSPTMLGEGYQPYVFWGDLQIYGDDIEVVVKYESPTGRTVSSETVHVKVPPRKA